MQHDQTNPNPNPNPSLPNLPTDRRALIAGIGGLAAGALLAGKAQAGPLNPPPGPIAPTPGPEPRIAVNATNTPGDATNTFRITQSGSYYLTGNITGEVGKNAILITVSDVTLDLNGFAIQGAPGAAMGIRGDNAANITVTNGSVRGFLTGVSLNGTSGGNVLRGVSCVGNSVTGILATNGTLTRCIAFSNAAAGFVLSGSSSVVDCFSDSNGTSGFSCGGNAHLERCIANFNTGNGFTANGNAAFFNCEAVGNASGFVAAAATTLRDCIAVDNRQSGISCTGTNAGGVISGCTCRFNQADGIAVSNGLLVRDNTLFRNTSAGIRVTGADNRIEANNATGGALGIAVAGTGNVVLRNTCSGNSTNYVIAANNRYGPIIDITATGTAAVNGNSAPSTLAAPSSAATTDPHANFAY